MSDYLAFVAVIDAGDEELHMIVTGERVPGPFLWRLVSHCNGCRWVLEVWRRCKIVQALVVEC